jgi:hypothetical protein
MDTSRRVYAGGNIGIFPHSRLEDGVKFDVMTNDDGTFLSWSEPTYSDPIIAANAEELAKAVQERFGDEVHSVWSWGDIVDK